MSIIASDPSMQKASEAIAGMDPASALQYLASHGVNQGLAIGVLEAAQLKQAAKTQQAIQSVMGPQPNVLQQNHDALQQMMNYGKQQQMSMQGVQAIQQHAADQARQGGIANLPVGPSMFGPKMADGGIVAFPTGGMVGIGGDQLGLDAADLVSGAETSINWDDPAVMRQRAAAVRQASYARAGIQPPSPVTRSPFVADSAENIAARAAANRGAGAAAAGAAEGAGAAGAAEGAGAAAPGLLSRLGSLVRGNPVTAGIYGLLHSPDTVSQDEEASVMDKYRTAHKLPSVYSGDTQAAPPQTPQTPQTPPQDTSKQPPVPTGPSVSEQTKNILRLSGMNLDENKDPLIASLEQHINDAKPKSIADRIKEQREALGPNTALDDYRKELDTQKGMAKLNADSQLRMARAAAFFNMGAAAGQPGQAGNALTKFLNAANAGGASYSQAVPHIQQGLMAAQQKIAEDKFKLADAQRREDSDMLKDASREYGADQRNYSAMVGDLAKFKAQEHGANVRAMVQEYGLNARAKQYNDVIQAQYIKADAAEKGKFIQYGMMGADQRLNAAIKAINDPMMQNNPQMREQSLTEYKDALAHYYAWNSKAQEHLGITSPTPGSSAASYSKLWGGGT